MSVQGINAEQRKAAQKLIDSVEEFRKLSADMQAQQIVVFLHIMAKPNISFRELEAATGLSSSSVSRNVLALSEWYKKDVKGHDLVEAYEDPQNRRAKLVRPKPKGVRVYNSLIQILRT